MNDFDALQEAVRQGNLEEVIRLLQIPEVLQSVKKDDYLNNTLRNAARNGRLEVVVNILLQIPEVLQKVTADNHNVELRLAAECGHLNVVNRLLEIPKVVALATTLDNIVLRFAAQNGHVEVVDRLLQITQLLQNVTALNRILRVADEKGHNAVVVRLRQAIAQQQASQTATYLPSQPRLNTTKPMTPPYTDIQFEIERLKYQDVIDKIDLGKNNPHLICPITGCLMRDPILLGATGRTFERTAIEAALRARPNINPLDNSSLNDSTLAPNYFTREAIVAFMGSKECQRLVNSYLSVKRFDKF